MRDAHGLLEQVRAGQADHGPVAKAECMNRGQRSVSFCVVSVLDLVLFLFLYMADLMAEALFSCKIQNFKTITLKRNLTCMEY